MRTVLLLTIANVFMTFAWYGHLKWFPHHKDAPVFRIILLSWGIAFFEYCFQVPANRAGDRDGFTLGQLKVMQEIITLAVFAAFSIMVMKYRLGWNYYAAFVLMVLAAFFIFMKVPGTPGGHAEGDAARAAHPTAPADDAPAAVGATPVSTSES